MNACMVCHFRNKSILRRILPFFLVFFLNTLYSFGEGHSADSSSDLKPHKKQEYNAGQMIMSHIGDAHEWHLFTIGDKHVSIPLPVILYYSGNIDVFLSSKFHHGHTSYKGYKLEMEGEDKGKIIRVKEDGHTKDENASMILDISITKNVMSIFISVFLLSLIFISVSRAYQRRKNAAPRGLQSLLEVLVLFVRDDIARPAIGAKKAGRFMPFLLTVFFFIFFNNLLGLVPIFPGGANVTGNISVTLVLALFTFVVTTFSGNRDYWKHIFNTPGVPIWLKIPPLMPIIELIGVVTKPFVLMIRLFANMMAGHIIMLGFLSIIFIFGASDLSGGLMAAGGSVIFVVFMSMLELLVAFIQAYVFTLLSALYFGLATEEHNAHSH